MTLHSCYNRRARFSQTIREVTDACQDLAKASTFSLLNQYMSEVFKTVWFWWFQLISLVTGECPKQRCTFPVLNVSQPSLLHLLWHHLFCLLTVLGLLMIVVNVCVTESSRAVGLPPRRRLFRHPVPPIFPHHRLGAAAEQADLPALQTAHPLGARPGALWPRIHRWACPAHPWWSVSNNNNNNESL